MSDGRRTDGVSPNQVGRLLMQHRAALYGYIYACVRNHDDTEDIIQTVSMAATESISQLMDERGFLPWVREIARRRVLAYRRTFKREQPYDPDLVTALAEAAHRIEGVVSASDQQAALRACLESLPGTSRTLITKRYDGSTESIGTLAEMLGRSVQSVYAQIKRIKMALRDCVSRRLAMEQ